MAEGRKRITGKSTSSQETKKKRLGAKTQEYKHPEYDRDFCFTGFMIDVGISRPALVLYRFF